MLPSRRSRTDAELCDCSKRTYSRTSNTVRVLAFSLPRFFFKLLDNVQRLCLQSTAIFVYDALHAFNLVPLRVRRDDANLDLVHRIVLEHRRPCFNIFFGLDTSVPPGAARRHARHLVDPRSLRAPNCALRSALGEVRVYNILPDAAVCLTSVKQFQSMLSKLVKERSSGGAEWADTLSWSFPMASHPCWFSRNWPLPGYFSVLFPSPGML